MVGVGMAVDGHGQLQLQLVEQAQVVVELVPDRVDQQGLALIGQQVAVRIALAVD
ncbi:hypothetical protein D3C81_2241540 [compost metagenome]